MKTKINYLVSYKNPDCKHKNTTKKCKCKRLRVKGSFYYEGDTSNFHDIKEKIYQLNPDCALEAYAPKDPEEEGK